MLSKSQLAIQLSRLLLFENPLLDKEQYPTDSEIAADILWHAYMFGDIENKTIADLGAGTGILGIGALMLGAKNLIFVDIDQLALEKLQENLEAINITKKKYRIIHKDINDVLKKDFQKDFPVQVILQNPPFGTKTENADKFFLQKAFTIAPIIYSFHKSSTAKFIEAIAKDHHYKITHEFKYQFPLKQTMKMHKSRIKRIEVSCFRFSLFQAPVSQK
ncbi:RsmD family RNA methyltransferase [Candidatus Woesearchaeota archaeon]|nr:RsmD family RNA methyltransferase [Candidatus Woesearchaeota archaeon]